MNRRTNKQKQQKKNNYILLFVSLCVWACLCICIHSVVTACKHEGTHVFVRAWTSLLMNMNANAPTLSTTKRVGTKIGKPRKCQQTLFRIQYVHSAKHPYGSRVLTRSRKKFEPGHNSNELLSMGRGLCMHTPVSTSWLNRSNPVAWETRCVREAVGSVCAFRSTPVWIQRSNPMVWETICHVYAAGVVQT